MQRTHAHTEAFAGTHTSTQILIPIMKQNDRKIVLKPTLFPMKDLQALGELANQTYFLRITNKGTA